MEYGTEHEMTLHYIFFGEHNIIIVLMLTVHNSLVYNQAFAIDFHTQWVAVSKILL